MSMWSNLRRAALTIMVLSGALGACSDPASNETVQAVTETGYLKCDTVPSCDGALCTTDAGATECVPLPSACDGVLSCACLGASVCEEGATCQDGSGGITCEMPETCTPGESFGAADGCNTCICPDSGIKSEAACTLLGCIDDPCAGKSCGETCSTCTPSGGATCPAVEEYCTADGECTQTMPTCPATCTPGATFDKGDGCNQCTCPDSGLEADAECTSKDCAKVVCEDKACGAPCSTCFFPEQGCPDVEETCRADGVCSAGPAQCPETCEPGSSWTTEDGCQMCTCQDSGLKSEALCTQQACTKLCNSHADCEDEASLGSTCFAPGEEIGCGPCLGPDEISTCTSSADCDDPGSEIPLVCEMATIDDCLCDFAMICKPGCVADTNCDTGESCVDSHCVATSCEDESTCPTDFGCTEAGACARKACTDSSGCEGECVKGLCYPTKGYCGEFPA